MEIEVTTTSGKVVRMRDLNAMELCNANRAAERNGAFGYPASYYEIAMAITKLNELEREPATSDLQLETIIDRLKARDFNELQLVWSREFGAKEAARVGDVATLSTGRRFEIDVDLTARQQLNADRCAGFSASATEFYRIASFLVASVDDTGKREPLSAPDPANPKSQLDDRLISLRAGEYRELVSLHTEVAQPNRLEIKNV